MMDLDELERKAMAAIRGAPGPWKVAKDDRGPFYVRAPSARWDVQEIAEASSDTLAIHIAACSPETVLALVRVAKVGLKWKNSGGHPCGTPGCGCMDCKLWDALAALSSDAKERTDG